MKFNFNYRTITTSRNECTLGKHVPKRYLNLSFQPNNFDLNTQKRILNWIENENSFLVYLGRTGCGKTKFSISLGYHLLQKKQKIVDQRKPEYHIGDYEKYLKKEITIEEVRVKPQILVVDHPSIEYYPINKLYDEFRYIYSQDRADIYFKQHLKELDYLILDDLGASRNNEWQVEIIYEIIDQRYSECKPTIITSNFTFDEIEKIFHSRIRSRLEAKENLKIVNWDDDFRLDSYTTN